MDDKYDVSRHLLAGRGGARAGNSARKHTHLPLMTANAKLPHIYCLTLLVVSEEVRGSRVLLEVAGFESQPAPPRLTLAFEKSSVLLDIYS